MVLSCTYMSNLKLQTLLWVFSKVRVRNQTFYTQDRVLKERRHLTEFNLSVELNGQSVPVKVEHTAAGQDFKVSHVCLSKPTDHGCVPLEGFLPVGCCYIVNS